MSSGSTQAQIAAAQAASGQNAEAARNALDFAKQQFAVQQAQRQPFVTAGTASLNALMNLLGLQAGLVHNGSGLVAFGGGGGGTSGGTSGGTRAPSGGTVTKTSTGSPTDNPFGLDFDIFTGGDPPGGFDEGGFLQQGEIMLPPSQQPPPPPPGDTPWVPPDWKPNFSSGGAALTTYDTTRALLELLKRSGG